MNELLKKDIITERDYILVDEQKIYLWFDIYEDGYKDGNIIQNFIMSYIEFEYNDLDIDFKEKEVKAYKEIKNGDVWVEEFLGSFIVTDINSDDTKQTIKIKGYDYALKFTEYYSSELNYESNEITLQDVSNEITAKLGLPNAILDINANFIVENDQFTNTQTQNGTVIKLIAGATGNRARIYKDKLIYQFANETNIVLNKFDYTELEDKRDTAPITIVVLGQKDIIGQEAIRSDEELIEQYGENKLVINDNLFAWTIEKREQLIDAIFNKVKGFGYSSFIAEGTNAINLNIGDKFKFENANGELIDSIILQKTTKATEIELGAKSVTKAIIDYQEPLTAEEIAKKTEIKVDRDLQTINETIETLTTQVATVEEKLETTGTIENSVETEIYSVGNDIYNVVFHGVEGDETTEVEYTIANEEEQTDTIAIALPNNEFMTALGDTADILFENGVLRKYIGKENGEYYVLNEYYDVVLSNDEAEKLSSLTTYKGLNTITTNVYLNATYDIDSEFNEQYLTTHEAKKQFNQINVKFTNQEQTNAGFIQTIADVSTTLNNDYLTAEQVTAGIQGNYEDIQGLQGQIATIETTVNGQSITLTEFIEKDEVSKIQNNFVTINQDGITLEDDYSPFASNFNKQNATFKYNDVTMGTIGLLDDKGNYGVDFPTLKSTNAFIAGSRFEEYTKSNKKYTGAFR